ncbi:MAG TPA: phospholipase C, phosphocholine-specific [Puia sp.]
MDTRRDFLKKAALLSSAASLEGLLPSSIQKAFAINPDNGTTWQDAEHVVILMQENRSFDHAFGTLKGVRGFNDPRAITLPNKNKVWLQTDEKNRTFAPFRYNLKDTRITWMSSLPHAWENQVDARNHGKYDKWLEVKKSGNADYKEMPLTMGYYNREDVPFYYALADAFTICDHNFCSSFTGTTPNRLYLWTGTVREKPHISSKANVRNSDVDYGRWASWTTYPERLEDSGVSWRIYQNELSLHVGMEFEEQEWLCNFTDNPIEWFEQYNVRFAPGYHPWLLRHHDWLTKEMADLQKKLDTFTGADKEREDLKKAIAQHQDLLQKIEDEKHKWTPEEFERLSPRAKSLHAKAFTTNSNDPHYHELITHKYTDEGVEREVRIPKGDVLHQFREDVKNGQLPQVSWIVAPARFSDHPGGPWYGVWYLSEVIDILTQNPEVWKKTIFILNYDENDGYFDHVPPFVAPDPARPGSGKASAHIDTSVEQVSAEQELERAHQYPPNSGHEGRTGPIGLGYRVPMIVASPWSRGGAVCSEIFDHTSVLQFLEKFLYHKTGRHIIETNISDWRRTVCGDLTSVFKPYNGEPMPTLQPVKRADHMELITNAKFKPAIPRFIPLTEGEIAAINKDPKSSPQMPKQEKGIRPSRPLPYQLYVEGQLAADKKTYALSFNASNEIFRDASAGSPFIVYATGSWKDMPTPAVDLRAWNYTVSAGDTLTDTWNLADFENEHYKLEVYGPNGFYRVFAGTAHDPAVAIACEYQRSRLSKRQPTGNLQLNVKNLDPHNRITLIITDNAYSGGTMEQRLAASAGDTIIIPLERSFGWYDISVRVSGHENFEKRYAGKVETGKESFSDPLMGQVTV